MSLPSKGISNSCDENGDPTTNEGLPTMGENVRQIGARGPGLGLFAPRFSSSICFRLPSNFELR